MIDPKRPDYTNTPASELRPTPWYEAAEEGRTPLFTAITPYYNTGFEFWETLRCLQRQSIPYWEWLIVDDGSADAASLEQLRAAQEQERRIRVIHQKNGGPAVARNRGAREARGKYLFFLDSDDLVEPTFVEKAIWFLETQPPGFAAVSAYNVTFGAKNQLWPYGFNRGSENVHENHNTVHSVIRTTDYQSVGGFDESISYEHADWDFWLTLAEAGLWGYTIPEYLTWYRMQARSLLSEIEGDRVRAANFRKWLQTKHAGLEHRFPQPHMFPAGYIPPVERHTHLSVENPLAKSESNTRVLLIVPWLEVGGADRFNLDMLRELTKQGYEFTVAATLRDEHPWLHEFTQLTPDVFCLHHFLNLADHPRFLSYLIESRKVDAVMVSNSALGYALLPYLRARHPNVALLDYTHMEEPNVANGGYPGLSAEAGGMLDLRVTNTDHLRAWMIAHGVSSDSIEVRRCGVDTNVWRRQDLDIDAMREKLGARRGEPHIAFIGRLVPQKRPMLVAEILKRLAEHGHAFHAVIVGSGEEEKRLTRFLRKHKLETRVRLAGTLTPPEIRELLTTSDFLLLPSQQEGLAIVLMEAMAMGVIPVTADVGGQRELVTPESGVLVPAGPQELDAYVTALETLFPAGPERRRAMANAAREAVLERFDIAQLGVGLNEAFTRAIKQHTCAQVSQCEPNLLQAAVEADRIIRAMAQDDADDAAWREHSDNRLIAFARRLRAIYLPTGSRRFSAYKALRVSLRTSIGAAMHSDV